VSLWGRCFLYCVEWMVLWVGYFHCWVVWCGVCWGLVCCGVDIGPEICVAICGVCV